MEKDIFDFSFEEIASESNSSEDAIFERLEDIIRYEKLYLLKPQDNAPIALSELADEKRIELFDGVHFSGFRRNYLENLTERDYSLEGCTPYQIYIDSVVLEDGSWGDMLCKLASYLLDTYPTKKADIEQFRVHWTKVVIFSSEKKTNFKPICTDLFLNCNHTALHSCWLIQDLLDFFGIDKSSVKFLIHRPNYAERQELKDYIEKEFKRGFSNYICAVLNNPSEYANKVIRNIDKYINPIFSGISKSYPNCFLFDDVNSVSNYFKKVKTIISGNLKYEEKVRKILCKYLDFLLYFYKL